MRRDLLTVVLFVVSRPLAAADAPPGFTPLWNGHDLAGWHYVDTFDPRVLAAMSETERAAKLAKWRSESESHWRVEGDEIVNDGKGAFLTTDRDFGDFELRVEFKIAPGTDSGIYLRGCPQVQIWDPADPNSIKHGADKGSGGLWNNSTGAPGKDPLVRADRPVGEWNNLRIVVVGERVSVWLNDQLVVDHARLENYFEKDRRKPLPRTGPIQLQTHGGEVRWRNLFVREIGPAEANEILAHGGPPTVTRADVVQCRAVWIADACCCNRLRCVVLPCIDSVTHTAWPKDDPGFRSVFNGQDLTGWAGPIENYEVIDGAIVCRPKKGGTIYTNDEFGDFVARLEFRLPPGGNNGLAIRYPGQGDTAYVGMCELQVLDNTDPRYARLDPRQFHGSAYGMAAAERGYLRPVGEWNFQEVTVRGSTIVVELNGTRILDTDLSKITEYLDNKPHPGKMRTSGHFGFAGHSDPVAFRNIRIKRLP